MTYQLKDGRVRSLHCEAEGTHHCILSCRACNHMSPWAEEYFSDPDQLRRDLTILARYYRSQRFALSGGETLLHPRLPELMNIARDSGISDRVWVYSNGLLLGQMGPEFWRSVDTIRISLYPSTLMKVPLKEARKQARRHGVDIQAAYFPFFAEPHSELGTTDEGLISRIYATCRVAHVPGCHVVGEGYFYRCTRAMFIPRYLLGLSGPEAARDGVRIEDSLAFRSELLAYLNTREPLAACSHCLGSVGIPVAHRLEPRRAARLSRTTEELVDWERLERLESGSSLAPPVWSLAAKRILNRLPLAVRCHPAYMRLAGKARDAVW